MSRVEAVSSPLPPGAGRIRDLNWPDYCTSGTNSQPPLRCRITGAPFGGTLVNFGVGASTIWNFQDGVDCYHLTANAGAGTGCCYTWFNNVNVSVRTTPVTYWPFDDDWNVHRLVWIAKLLGNVATSNDMGPQLNSGNTSTAGIIKDNALGFGFRYAPGGGGNGKINFISRSNALGTTEVTLATDGVAGFNIALLHSYELRILSALPNQPPLIKVLLDDVLVQTIPWSGGTLPANGEQAATITGFYPVLFCNASNASTIATKYLSFQAGPTELACL